MATTIQPPLNNSLSYEKNVQVALTDGMCHSNKDIPLHIDWLERVLCSMSKILAL